MALKQVIVVRSDLKMSCGKACAQSAHASLEAFLKTQKKEKMVAENWLRQGMPKIIVKIESMKELLELHENTRKRFSVALIKDAGHTQVKKGSLTALGIGPAQEKELDKYTGKLKLL